MWDSVASDLFSAASAFQSVVWGLTVGSWIGSSAGLMVAAASPYVAWMSVTAGQAELTAAQVRVAAAAYETAYGLTVPPPVIAENRAELMILIATNLLGQNTPAIAVNEAEYGEMWAQDAAAMFGYAAPVGGARCWWGRGGRPRRRPCVPPRNTGPLGPCKSKSSQGI